MFIIDAIVNNMYIVNVHMILIDVVIYNFVKEVDLVRSIVSIPHIIFCWGNNLHVMLQLTPLLKTCPFEFNFMVLTNIYKYLYKYI